jgi:hypothetical protein
MTPNPDRKSDARRRQERIKVLGAPAQERWWLEPESGMLTKETIEALQHYKSETKKKVE